MKARVSLLSRAASTDSGLQDEITEQAWSRLKQCLRAFRPVLTMRLSRALSTDSGLQTSHQCVNECAAFNCFLWRCLPGQKGLP